MKTNISRSTFALAALALLGMTHNANAQTTLSGHYDNNRIAPGNGYEATAAGSPYTVTPTATFNNNGNTGLNVVNATVTVNGGQFLNNDNYSIFAVNSQVTINGGTFSGAQSNNVEAADSSITINGGDFTGNFYGLALLANASFTLKGGNFSNNSDADLVTFDPTAALTVFGSDFTYNGISNYFGTISGTGSFSGKLQNNTAVQTFTYDNSSGGTITLAPVPGGSVPEPGSVALLFGMATVGVSVLRRRRK